MPGREGLPDHWLSVLRAVADLCQTENTDGISTRAVARHLRDHGEGTPASARLLLRTLRRHGYLHSPTSPDDDPARWALTAKGHDYLATHE